MLQPTKNIDYNLLGTIYEQSLDRYVRKHGGIFYSPKYITDYICKNTIGVLCNEKKQELDFFNLNIEKLQTYKTWLLTLKILDPACGSGAFLNATLDFLIAEHQQIDNLISELTGDKMRIFDTDKQILENNIYGVDINDESVEISKLSLWLRTAQKGRVLSDLSNNIKCGNSLIDDPEIAGEKAFNWNVEFKEIMDNGGFDVVIGNPPYVGEKGNKNVFRQLQKAYKNFYTKNADLIYFFFFRAINLIKNSGFASFITTNYYLTADSAILLREELKRKTSIYLLTNFHENKLFESALGQHNIITFFNKNKKLKNCKIVNVENENDLKKFMANHELLDFFIKEINELYEDENNYIRTFQYNNKIDSIFKKIKTNSLLVDEICYVNTGFDSSADKVTQKNLQKLSKSVNIKIGQGIFVVSKLEYEKTPFEFDLIKKCYKSSDIEPFYSTKWQSYYVIYTDKDTNIESFPKIKNHLIKYKEILEYKKTEHKETLPWYSLHRAREIDVFTNTNKIVFPYRSKTNIFSLSDGEYFGSKDILYLRQKNENFDIKYLLAVLNSKLYYFWLYHKGKRKGETLEMYVNPIKEIPIKNISLDEQKIFIQLVNEIIEAKKKLPDYKELQNEAKKENDFTREIQLKKQTSELESRLKINFELVNRRVYELYDLTPEEIEIVENATSN